MDKHYRIKTDIGKDQVLNVNLQRGVDLYEVLTLTMSQRNAYKVMSSDYGVIVGRVLANDAFGVPNAKVSVFIGLSDSDSLRPDLSKLYPYKSVTGYDSKGVRYNTLPNYKTSECHVPVGSFPSKRMVLDNDSTLEVYDKYYKYTTVTNKSGDYMIFGVPIGNQTLHVDVDLSDIGVLSQKPRDMMNRGYSSDLFANPSQFKESTNLDDLAQILSQTASVDVYPFWGDTSSNQISITRKDINLQYDFQPTCVFMGSVVTDSSNNYIGHTCEPSEKVGDASQLTACEGTIEMIRKRIDGNVEEYNINGNHLIDANGVFCYQIPMNLDYVGMDEYGNIVPTDNPNKGIATRARVRFRFTLSETGNDSYTSHKARYLVPNNPDIYEGNGVSATDKNVVEPHVKSSIIDDDMFYEFGTKTPDECFRDLYWNKIYSVKSYIPRLQLSQHEKSPNYLGIKGVNKHGAWDKNPFPYNKLNLNFTVPAYFIERSIGISNSNIAGFWRYQKTDSIPYTFDSVTNSIIEEMDAIGLDFYNDWINGCLYFPLWFWHIKKRAKYKKGESVFDSHFCECSGDNLEGRALYLFNNCSPEYEKSSVTGDTISVHTQEKDVKGSMYNSLIYGVKQIHSGAIKKFTNKDGAEIYYYSYGNRLLNSSKERYLSESQGVDSYYPYARLFSTDIILLGSLNECDPDGIPILVKNLPASTCNIPPVGRYNEYSDNAGTQPKYTSDQKEIDIDAVNGMNWGAQNKTVSGSKAADGILSGKTAFNYVGGLFFGVKSHDVYRGKDWAVSILLDSLLDKVLGLFGGSKIRTDYIATTSLKTCVNAERICELGVGLDSKKNISVGTDEDNDEVMYGSVMDGLITSTEIEDNETRSLFASLNSHKLVGRIADISTTYKKYVMSALNTLNFDGRLKTDAPKLTGGLTTDEPNADYIDFKYGTQPSALYHTKGLTNVNYFSDYVTTINDDGSLEYAYKQMRKVRHFNYMGDNTVAFPLYNNSFYFYFGINNGSTAIDKLMLNYFAECKESKDYPFAYEITTEPAKACNKNADYAKGNITVIPSNIDFPYTVEVYNSAETYIVASGSVESNEPAVIQMSDNGTFVVKITDRLGNVMTDTVTLKYNPVSLKYTVEKNITTQFTNQSKCVICDKSTELYGTIILESVTLYGEEYKIKGIVTKGYEGDEGKYMYKLSLNGNDTIVKFVIGPSNGGDYKADYACGGVPCKNAMEMDDGVNKLYIYRPATYAVKVVELCDDGSDSSNVSYYNIEMTDEKKIDILLNTVPLKFIIGQNEDDIDSYSELFYKVGGDYAIDSIDKQLGWFGLHDEKTYKFPDVNDTENMGMEIWESEIGDSIPGNVLSNKLGYMFSLSAGAYVTANGKNKFTIGYENVYSNPLLRTASPTYGSMSSDNSETKDAPYKGFRISNDDTIVSNTNSPNIISENYRELDANGLPVAKGYTTGSLPYAYNKKYYNELYFNGNYMALFDNNSNIVEKDDTGCLKEESGATVNMLPINAHDLYENTNGLCADAVVTYPEDAAAFNTAFDHIYHKNGSKPYYPYFRAEFVDRRFDYDVLFISPHNRDDSELKYDGRWWQGRMSGITYNGIEMLYRDDVKRTILDKLGNDDVEYTYDVDSVTTSLNMEKPKRFYSSVISYGNGKNIDLRNGYHYKKRNDSSLSATCEETSLDFASFMGGHNIGDVTFDNFGLKNGSVIGYPSKRYIDFVGIPFNDYYTFTNVSCSYDGITVETTASDMTAGAIAGESVQFKIESGNLIVPILSSFDSDISSGEYNIKYSYNGGTWVANTFKLMFYIKTNVDSIDPQFTSKIEDDGKSKLGIRLLKDDANHSDYESLKMSKSVPEIETKVASMTVTKLSGIPQVPDTTEEFAKYKFSTGEQNILGAKNVGIMFDRYYYNITRDSLMKKIRVINTSAIYNCEDFTMQGSVAADLYDRVTFTFRSNYLKIGTTISDICFKISVNGEEHAYKLSSMTTSSGGNSFTVSFLMKDHLRYDITSYGTGKFEGYIKLQNGLIVRFDFCLDKYSNISIC